MSSPLIPREKLTAYQRWELTSFDSPLNDTLDRRQGGDRRQSSEPAPAPTPAPAVDNTRELTEQAYLTGVAEGMRRGSEQAAADVERLKALVAGLQQATAQLDRDVAGEVLALALELGRQMTRRALKVRPELIVPVVQEALARAVQPALQATISAHPDDAVLLREHLGEQLTTGGWTITEDAQMVRGGCTLHSSANQIDASAPSRWRQIVAALGQTGDWLE